MKKEETNMYTGTVFNWHDNSGFEVNTEPVDIVNRPLFMVVNGFDKGPEKLIEVDANNFNALFGNMSYEKYGQGSIQAQRIIDAGGRLLVKRVCAADAGLANMVLVATIENGELSWEIKPIETVGAETDAHAPVSFAEVKKAALDFYDKENNVYPLFIITDIGRGLSNKAVRISPDYDTSRGIEKMIYRLSVYEGTTLIENANITLDPSYTFNDEYYGLDKNRMTQITGEVIPEIYEEYVETITDLIYPQATEDKLPDYTKLVNKYDLINAYTYKGDILFVCDENGDPTDQVALKLKKNDSEQLVGDDLNVLYGNKFKYAGNNGVYGDAPAKYGNEHKVYDFKDGGDDAALISSPAPTLPEDPDDPTYPVIASKIAYRRYVLDIASVYLGVDTDGSPIDQVWDTDSHKIFAVADANYHKIIKDCMANFVEFRKDCLLLRDSGIGYYNVIEAQDVYTTYTLKNVLNTDFDSYEFSGKTDDPSSAIDPKAYALSTLRSKFFADYGTTYEVVDPVSRKNIEVTMIYDIVNKLVTQYIDQGPFAPLAGTYNGYQLDSAIPGTINFTPIITPTSNQKQVIDDIRLNYAIFEDEDVCVVQSNYTSQNSNTQLSFINNVLAIQEVARVVRTACPRNRFRLITGSDMTEYANAVSRVLQSYNNYFETLEFQYTQDPLRSVQKIFYASINFAFNNWAQTEIFDLYALANVTQTSVNS
jgi:hypothetical protein